MPRVFLSYTHVDKAVAGSLVRRLVAHGVEVWIDERGLRPGDELTALIRGEIGRSDAVIIVASRASDGAPWVRDELGFARKAGVRTIPFLVEPVAASESFRDRLGIDATNPARMSEAVHHLMTRLYGAAVRQSRAQTPRC